MNRSQVIAFRLIIQWFSILARFFISGETDKLAYDVDKTLVQTEKFLAEVGEGQ